MVVEIKTIDQLTSQKLAFGGKSLECDDQTSQTWVSFQLQYQSNMLSGCGDNERTKHDPSEAGIWQKITGV